ncbi:reverse transcriptase-like protein [bacterium]|nr:MAG: reverse transcriptase-like protein [bacterium]
MKLLNVYTDGGSRGNPGPSAIGIVFKNEEGETIWEQNKDIGRATNNEAEYSALIYAMKHINRYHPEKVCFYSDSELMIRQMKGEYKIKNSGIQKLFLEAWNRKIDMKSKIEFIQIPREQNKEADALLNKILDQEKLGI